MTGCHLRKCHPASLIRQTGIGLAAGILCFLVLSYSDPSARKDEPEVGEVAPAPAEASLSAAGPDGASGAAATLIPPAETGFLPSAPESIERQVDGVAGKLTPMQDVPASGALPIVAEDYIHRIGRTGRAGQKGEAISLVCADEVNMLSAIEMLTRQTLPRHEEQDFEPEHRVPETDASGQVIKKPKKPKT